jgi:RNA polymerase sigma factor (sigma-70 family)
MSRRVSQMPALTPEQWGLVRSVERLVHLRVNVKVPWAKEPWQREEPVAAGRCGAGLAAQRFEARYGFRFSSYALPWIDGEIRRWIEAEEEQGEIKRQAAEHAREYLAEEPDNFDVSGHEPPEARAGVHDVARRYLGALFAGLALGPADPEEAYAAAERRALVRGVLDRLDPGKRAAFEMRFFEGRKLGEIMDALEVCERTVRRWLDEALAAVLEAVRALDEAP